MLVPGNIAYAIGQAKGSLYGIHHDMPFEDAIDTIRGWSDCINDAWHNTDTEDITESYDVAEEWMEDGIAVRVLDRKQRLRAVVGRELAVYL